MRLGDGQAGTQASNVTDAVTLLIPEAAQDRGSDFVGDNSGASTDYQARGCLLETLRACPQIASVQMLSDRSIEVTLAPRGVA